MFDEQASNLIAHRCCQWSQYPMTHRNVLMKTRFNTAVPLYPQTPLQIEIRKSQPWTKYEPVTTCLLALRRILGDGLCAFRHSVLGEFTRQDESDWGLDLSGWDGGLLGVSSELASLGCYALEDVYNTCQEWKMAMKFGWKTKTIPRSRHTRLFWRNAFRGFRGARAVWRIPPHTG